MGNQKSLPSWECGLKFVTEFDSNGEVTVTPFVGVWIEISLIDSVCAQYRVTPFVGVWIEIYLSTGMGRMRP